MFDLSVDFASKFSAAMVTDEAGVVHREWDSRGLSAFEFTQSIEEAALQYAPRCIAVEDLPYGISSQSQVKAPLRFQGVLMSDLRGFLDVLWFVTPSAWQKEFPGVGRAPKGLTKTQADKARIQAAREAAEELGYIAPDLVQRYIDAQEPGTRILKKHTNELDKNMTDYVDAFLISEWVRRNNGDIGSLNGVQPPMI